MFYLNPFVCFSLVLESLLLVILLGTDAVIQVSCLNFTYPSFPKQTASDFITTDHSQIVEQALQVTSDTHGAPIFNLSGRVLYRQKFKLWSKAKSSIASFNSTFVLNITPMIQPGGEGLAFILTGDPEIPINSEGQWLGIVNASTNGSSQGHIVAVEFDTRKSYVEDVDDNHVGVDVNSINSISQFQLSSHGVNLSSGKDVIASIRYDGKSGRMVIFVSMNNGTGFSSMKPTISLQLQLSKHLPEDVYVGFSASTGDLTELNCVKSWNFTGEDIEGGSSNHLLWVWIIIPVLILLFVGFACFVCLRRKPEKDQNEAIDQDIEKEIEGSTMVPHKFLLTELKSATRNFHYRNKLGKGGFGTVYKGFLKEINMEVAVKRVSKDSRQGKQEFMAEVTTISHLDHKNIVKLIGWCYQSDELLLVYKFMPNGSLDKRIFSEENPTEILSWERRYNIIYGVASALDYLHDGCEKRVLHRDIKASNVMLDSEFNARLGDFGLARTVQNYGETHHSTKEIAGTPGYMAPECCLTGRASVETDVYGFGVLVIEVACGRKQVNDLENHHNKRISIIDWVWNLYGKERIFYAADPRLQSDFDKEQMECVLKLGLACCHPNPNQRPSMKVVLQVLTGETAPPILPNVKPAFMWPVMDSLPDDSGLSFNGGQLTQSTDLSGR